MINGDAVNRPPIPPRTAATRLIVVLRASDSGDYSRVLDALIDAGIRSVELTMTTPGTIKSLPEIVARFGDAADIGVGTVTDENELNAAIGAGAHYIVTPITDARVVSLSVEAGIPVVPGGLTPTELFTSWRAGASAVKVFPASQVSANYVNDLRGPFPGIDVIPSGGVNHDMAADWLAAGAAAVSVGGPLLGDAMRGGSLRALRERAAAFVALCASGGAR